MLIDYKSCRERFGSPYQIEKAVRDGRLFKMEARVYSDTGEESEIEVLLARYPRALERLLIETARMKNRMPSDQYKEVIGFYRRERDKLDASKFPEYLERFPHRDRIMGIIDVEVY